MNPISHWFRRHLADPQVVGLVLVLLAVSLTVLLAGDILAPVFAAVIFAYLLSGLERRLERIGVPHLASTVLVFLVFITALLALVLLVLPLLLRQLAQLLQQIPLIMATAQGLLLELSEQYPSVITERQISEFVTGLGGELVLQGQRILTFSLSSLVTVITIGVYLIIVPLLVFFLVRDQNRIIEWLEGFLPRDRQLTDTVWAEVNDQIGNYVRGKVWEILIVGSVTYAVFSLIGLQYAALLAVATGLSVLIPYVGAAAVTVPVALVAFFQWGLSAEFWWALIAYGVIQLLDGNLLAPLLFSEAVNLHPVAIIVAILVFGGLWGFWGVFFAIPLATVINAIIRAWPRSDLAIPAPVALTEERAES